MLGRLFKHEMKHAAPFFLLLYGIFLAVTALARVGMELMERYEVLRFPSMLLFIGYVVGIMVVFLFPGFYAVIRFYRNLTGPQGYLMFALPVRTCSHVWAKLLSAMLWELASGIVFCLSLLEMAVGGTVMDDIRQLAASVPAWLRSLGGWNGGVFLAEMLLLLLVSSASRLLLFYASIAIGQCLSTRHRLLGAVGGYLGLSFVTQSVMSILLTVFAAVGGNRYFLQLLNGGANPFAFLNASVNLLLLIYLLVMLLFTSAYYLVTVILLDKKLNLA